MPSSFTPSSIVPDTDTPSLWFLFQGFRLLVWHEDQGVKIPRITSPAELGLIPTQSSFLGVLNNKGEAIPCYCGELGPDIQPPPGYMFESLRPLYSQLDEQSFWLAGRAVQIVDWARTSQYCGRCGHATTLQTHDRSKICPNCGLTQYPQLAPAVIVRVQRTTSRGPEILLARAQRFPTSLFSVLAGFVEPGESLEECVEREIYEEVGITIKNIAYFGSQPWPFPHSLMVAFTAEYDEGELQIDLTEIAEAGWYAPDRLPGIPTPPSIANRLITSWLAEYGQSGRL